MWSGAPHAVVKIDAPCGAPRCAGWRLRRRGTDGSITAFLPASAPPRRRCCYAYTAALRWALHLSSPAQSSELRATEQQLLGRMQRCE